MSGQKIHTHKTGTGTGTGTPSRRFKVYSVTDLFSSLFSFDFILNCFENWIIRFEDSCGVYYPFQKERNIPVECNSDESHTPGKTTTYFWGVIQDRC